MIYLLPTPQFKCHYLLELNPSLTHKPSKREEFNKVQVCQQVRMLQIITALIFLFGAFPMFLNLCFHSPSKDSHYIITRDLLLFASLITCIIHPTPSFLFWTLSIHLFTVTREDSPQSSMASYGWQLTVAGEKKRISIAHHGEQRGWWGVLLTGHLVSGEWPWYCVVCSHGFSWSTISGNT